MTCGDNIKSTKGIKCYLFNPSSNGIQQIDSEYVYVEAVLD